MCQLVPGGTSDKVSTYINTKWPHVAAVWNVTLALKTELFSLQKRKLELLGIVLVIRERELWKIRKLKLNKNKNYSEQNERELYCLKNNKLLRKPIFAQAYGHKFTIDKTVRSFLRIAICSLSGD